jgi:hypothetical protein
MQRVEDQVLSKLMKKCETDKLNKEYLCDTTKQIVVKGFYICSSNATHCLISQMFNFRYEAF